MEFVAGGTLADVLASGPLPAERALRLAAQVADALAAAHAASIVHRDLKPSNIMMPAADRVKVVDFGLAKLAGAAAPRVGDGGRRSPRAASIVGTAPYMSPEQAAGRAVDARSDLFSLGTILYEMLAGRGAVRQATGSRHARGDPPGHAGADPGSRPPVARLVDRCLRKDPADRFQSAAELKAAIEACLAPQRAADGPSVAVLPFTNMSGVEGGRLPLRGSGRGDHQRAHANPGLRVIARTSAFAVGRMGLDVREAGARLDVEHASSRAACGGRARGCA